MKALTSFTSLATLTANSENANFPAANVRDLDPHKRWKANQYTTEEWLKVDFGGAASLTALFLNQCNFPAAVIEGHASDSWTSPTFSQAITLVVDETGNRKGFFDLTAFNFRWLRLVIAAGQTLDNSEAVPAVGNMIAGTAVVLPLVGVVTPTIKQRYSRFEADDGSLFKTPRGYKKQVLSVQVGDTLDNIRALSKTWTMGVLFADMGNVGDSWLVYPPEDWTRPTRSINDAELTYQLEERP